MDLLLLLGGAIGLAVVHALLVRAGRWRPWSRSAVRVLLAVAVIAAATSEVIEVVAAATPVDPAEGAAAMGRLLMQLERARWANSVAAGALVGALGVMTAVAGLTSPRT